MNRDRDARPSASTVPTAGSATEPEDSFSRLARESGGILGELGVRPDDDRWIRAHAEAIESLRHAARPRRWGIFDGLYRLARRAARTAR